MAQAQLVSAQNDPASDLFYRRPSRGKSKAFPTQGPYAEPLRLLVSSALGEKMNEPKKKPKTTKDSDLVQLHRGGKYMKKSSAKYFAKKNADTNRAIGWLLVGMLVLGIVLSQCS